MTDEHADLGIITCIYCGGLEDASNMSDVPMEESEHITVDPSELPQGIAECVVWETRIAHKCRACMAAETEIVH